MNQQTVYIVYFSPAGTTRMVAQALAHEASTAGYPVVSLDLASRSTDVKVVQSRISKGDILFAGTPVYANHPVPVVMDFLAGLSETEGAYAAPFVTFGAVSSGVALREMATMAKEKKMTVLGGIKVAARHSMLWQSDAPLGKGRPDEKDMAEVARFAQAVMGKASADGKAGPLPEDALNYQRQEVQEAAKAAGLHVIKPMLLPFDVNIDACTQCGLCVENCPTANITLEEGPVFADRCVVCFNCVRVCEPGAISSKVLPFIEADLHKRLDFFREPAETVAFV
ncbi:EFR1 family ferrodoxin [Desulfosudis oleivorans]|uniref:4Fe-4S ferredoxin iron-sulfur binding domain protein n=1 Tax=Desulfosudis oleivorans (strain DSM 6200 / JCM 39069 / Hxd3) TaxID=96561 RepID=A9A0R9_DESOH|nr:EFR1 family ferrodoxin [Desulfosudis oleivorans]ABW67544.1 4Fe-4S ferredoxin iron-sulfur binding domain protein [Desulfosudis oleivorans Hxd3]